MSTEIRSFVNENFGQVRVIERGGEPWFVAKDVAEALGYQWSGIRNVQHVPEEWRVVETVSTSFGEKETWLLSEQGLYFFLGRSDKAAAIPYQKWVAGEIMPSIRKTGGYGLPPAEKYRLEDRLAAGKLILEAAGIVGNQLSLAMDKAYRKMAGGSFLEMSGTRLIAPVQSNLYRPSDIPLELKWVEKTHNGIAKKVNTVLEALGLQEKEALAKNEWRWKATELGFQYGATYSDTNKKHSDGTTVRKIRWDGRIFDFLRDKKGMFDALVGDRVDASTSLS